MIPPSDRKSKIWSVSASRAEIFSRCTTSWSLAITPRPLAGVLSERQRVCLTMLSLMTFGAGFLMRPSAPRSRRVHRPSRPPRRVAADSGLMSVGIFSIACMPGYATIGLLRHCWCWSAGCCKDFRPAWNWAESRSICRRSPRPATRLLRQLAVRQPANRRHVRGTIGVV